MSGDMYDWDHCDHKGIGRIGCPTCDFDKGRVMIRAQRVDNHNLRAEIRDLKARLKYLKAATQWTDLDRRRAAFDLNNKGWRKA